MNRKREILSLFKRMDEHFTLTEAEQYKMSCPDELMEFMWLKPAITNLDVDIFVDDGMSYKRNNHQLLLFARNGYNKSCNEFIPISISNLPCVLDDDMDFKISYDDIFDIQDFIQLNLEILIALSERQITQEEFVKKIKKPGVMVAENKKLIMEMVTLRSEESHLPVDIWVDEGATYQGHAPRIKFRASNDQKTTREFSSMLIQNPPTIENLPKNCPIRKRDMDKIKRFVLNNLELLIKLSNGEIVYLTDFKQNMIL